jgi:hypothetical protein
MSDSDISDPDVSDSDISDEACLAVPALWNKRSAQFSSNVKHFFEERSTQIPFSADRPPTQNLKLSLL